MPCRNVRFTISQQPRQSALRRRGKLIDIVEEQRARPGFEDRGATTEGLEVETAGALGGGAEELFVDVGRFGGTGVQGDDRRPAAAAVLEALEQLLRSGPRLRQQQHGGAPDGRKRKRRPRPTDGVRPAYQRQRDL